MKNLRKNLLLALSVLGTILMTTACFERAEDEKLMVMYTNHGDDIKTMDPATSYDSISWDVVPSFYEQLYQYSYLAEPFQMEPLLAADMPKFSSDRKTVTIRIKKDVKFADDPCFKETEGKGRELKAQDFIYAWKRLAIPAIQSQGWWIFEGKIVGIDDFKNVLSKGKKEDLPKLMNTPISGLKAIDDYTIEIKLVRPYPQLLYILAMPFTSPVPHEAITAYGDENGNLHSHPVGTGPYILSKWDRGHRIVLDRNPNYHADFYPTKAAPVYEKMGLLADAGKPLPFLDRISIDVIKEDQPAWLKFMKGQLDLAGIPKDNFKQAMSNQMELSADLKKKGITLFIENENTFYYISFNMKDKVVGTNKYLRQAMSSAFDRNKFIELFTNGRGRVPTSALPPGIPDRADGNVLKYGYNLERAKELMKKAGFPDGKGLPQIKFDMRGADSFSRQMGEYFTQQMKAIGVDLQVIYNTFPAYLEKSKQGNLQVSLGGWAMDYPDAENTYQLLYGPNKAPGPNDSNFDNPEMNKLYEQLAIMESGPKRQEVVKKLEAILQEECPWALIYYRTAYHLQHGWFKNRRPNATILNTYKYYKIDKELRKQLQSKL